MGKISVNSDVLRWIIGTLLPLLLMGVMFMYPIPDTGLLRNILFLIILLLFVIAWKARYKVGVSSVTAYETYKYPLFVLLAITCWMFLQTFLFGINRAESFNDLLEEWLIGVIVFSWVGWRIAGLDINNRLITWITIAMLMHVIWLLIYQFQTYLSLDGIFPYGATPYARKDFISVPISFSFVLLVSDLSASVLFKKRILLLPLRVVMVLLVPVLMAIITVKARNVVISAVVVLSVLAIVVFVKSWQEKRFHMDIAVIAAPFMLMSMLAVANLSTDTRWDGFIETVKVSTNIHNNKAWLDHEKHPYPKTINGTELDRSAYQRIAMGLVAIEGIRKHPNGYGYGLGGFGRYIEEEYGYKGFVSSHSGILDFTLANGVIGLLLWLVFCVVLFWSGWRCFRNNNPWGLLLILMLSIFLIRIVLDGHFGGFRLKMFALLMGGIFYSMVGDTLKKSHS